jgi:hypothetical protein
MAIDEALAQLSEHVIEDKIEALFDSKSDSKVPLPGMTIDTLRARGDDHKIKPLSNEDWIALARVDVDLQLSALFAIVAPAFAAERARMRPPPNMLAREYEVPDMLARVIVRVVRAFGIPRPPVYFDREQLASSKVVTRVRAGQLVPVLMIGPTLETADPQELAFTLARQLADLRNDRIARLLCPRPPELAQIVELATSLAAGEGNGSHAARWLTTSLHPVELDQARMIGTRLRERGINPMTAALNWLAATERAADRIGFIVVGDLAVATRVIEREPQVSASDVNRVLELLWSSTTEEVLGVRARVEGWPQAQVGDAVPAAAAR